MVVVALLLLGDSTSNPSGQHPHLFQFLDQLSISSNKVRLDIFLGVFERSKQTLQVSQLVKSSLALLTLLIQFNQSFSELLVAVQRGLGGRNSNQGKLRFSRD